MPPIFENLSLDALNNEQIPQKKRSSGRSTGVDFEIYRLGRVKKIATWFHFWLGLLKKFSDFCKNVKRFGYLNCSVFEMLMMDNNAV